MAVRERDVPVAPTDGNAETLARLGGLTMQVAHDLRSYLSAIGTLAATLDHELEPDHRGRAAVEELVQAAAAACGVASQLLQAGQAAPAPVAPLDLGHAVAECAPLLRNVLGPELSLELVRDGLPCHVRVHRHRLEQLLTNLVANAANAEPVDHRVTVGVRRVAEPGRVRAELWVSDRGCGMNEPVRRRASTPFFTTRLEQGTGLGLVIVEAVAREAGGDVRIESRRGKGTTVIVTMPAD